MKIKVVDWENKVSSELDFPLHVRSDSVRYDIMHRVVLWQRACARTGTRAVKARAMVKATGKKPFRQKGTGRARQGTTVAPQMRGGGVCFGPSPEIRHEYSLPKRVRRMGLRSALSLRLQEKKVFILKNEDCSSNKTKDLRGLIAKNDWKSSLFVSLDVSLENFGRACANINNVDVLPVLGLNVEDVLRHDKVFILENAVDAVLNKVRE